MPGPMQSQLPGQGPAPGGQPGMMQGQAPGVLFGQGGEQGGGEVGKQIMDAVASIPPETLKQIVSMPKEEALGLLMKMNIERGQTEDMALMIADTVYQALLDRFVNEGGDIESVNPDFFKVSDTQSAQMPPSGPGPGQGAPMPPGQVLFGGA
jgi:hypothetical protein